MLLGLAAVGALGASIALLQDGADAPAPVPPADEQVVLRELVERGVIPRQALLPRQP